MNVAEGAGWPSPLWRLHGPTVFKRTPRGVARALEGEAWDRALAHFRPLLLLLARQGLNVRLWKKVDPSDIVQKTLLEAHRKRADFRGSSQRELEAWLEMILGHQLIDEVRRLKCRKNDVDLEVPIEDSEGRLTARFRNSASPSGALARYEEALRLAEALGELPEEQSRAVEFYHLQGRTLSETAGLMEKSRGAVASLLHRGLVRLRGLLRSAR